MKKKTSSSKNSKKPQLKPNPQKIYKKPATLNKNNQNKNNQHLAEEQRTSLKNKQNSVDSTKKQQNEVKNEEKHEIKEIKLNSKILENKLTNNNYTYHELSSGLNKDLFLQEELQKDDLLKNKKNTKTKHNYFVININLKEIYNFLGQLEYQKLIYLFEELSGITNENNINSNNNKIFNDQINLNQILSFLENKNIFGEKITNEEIEKMFKWITDGSDNKNYINFEQYIFLLCEIGRKIHYYEKDDLIILKHLCDNELKNINILTENILSKYDRFYFMLGDENCNSLIREKYLTALKTLFELNSDKSGLLNINNFISICQKKNIIPNLLSIKEIIGIIRFIRSKKDNISINNNMNIKFFIETILLIGFVIYDKYLNIYKVKTSSSKIRSKNQINSISTKNSKNHIVQAEKKPSKGNILNSKKPEKSDTNLNGNEEVEEEHNLSEDEKQCILKFYEGENTENGKKIFLKQNGRLEIILNFIIEN